MDTVKKVWNWLVLSSVNPSKYSLMVKGILGTVGTIVLLAAGIFHFGIQPEQVNNIIDFIVLAVSATLTAVSYIAVAVSAWAVVWGGIRKGVTTVAGTNAVLNQAQ